MFFKSNAKSEGNKESELIKIKKRHFFPPVVGWEPTVCAEKENMKIK